MKNYSNISLLMSLWQQTKTGSCAIGHSFRQEGLQHAMLAVLRVIAPITPKQANLCSLMSALSQVNPGIRLALHNKTRWCESQLKIKG